MLRKITTLLLFTTTVPYAAFGQHHVDMTQVHSWLNEATIHAQNKWPMARHHLEKNLPDAVTGMATHLNDFNPSAGGHLPAQSCFPVAPSDMTKQKEVALFSI